jgi:hypothetical protein
VAETNGRHRGRLPDRIGDPERGESAAHDRYSRHVAGQAGLHSVRTRCQAGSQGFLKSERRVDSDQAGPESTRGQADIRVHVGVYGSVIRSPLVSGNEAIEVTLRPPSVSRCATQHQLNCLRRS